MCASFVIGTVIISPFSWAKDFDLKGKELIISSYGLTVFKDKKHHFLVLHVKNNVNTVADFITVPQPPNGYKYEIGLCKLDGVYKEKLAALIKWEWVEVRRDVIGAWVSDEKGEKLISVDPKKVYCDNDAWNA